MEASGESLFEIPGDRWGPSHMKIRVVRSCLCSFSAITKYHTLGNLQRKENYFPECRTLGSSLWRPCVLGGPFCCTEGASWVERADERKPQEAQGAQVTLLTKPLPHNPPALRVRPSSTHGGCSSWPNHPCKVPLPIYQHPNLGIKFPTEELLWTRSNRSGRSINYLIRNFHHP